LFSFESNLQAFVRDEHGAQRTAPAARLVQLVARAFYSDAHAQVCAALLRDPDRRLNDAQPVAESAATHFFSDSNAPPFAQVHSYGPEAHSR